MATISGKFNFYFEILEKIDMVKIVERYKCSNEKCKEHNKKGTIKKEKNFCCECGSEILKLSEKCVIPNTPYKFCEEYLNGDEMVSYPYEVELSNTNNQIWLYNYKVDFIPEHINKFNLDDGGIIDLEEIDVSNYLKMFKELNDIKFLISKLNEVFGENGYKIKYGLVAGYC